VKRPDRVIELAGKLPEVKFHMVGGSVPGEKDLFRQVKATVRPNVLFHGHLPYWEANDLCARARLLVNTSDVEGFPNAYPQTWVRGVPVVTLIDPDRVIEREGLGLVAGTPEQLHDAIRRLLGDAAAWKMASDRCRDYMAREYGEDKVLAAYLHTFQRVLRMGSSGAKIIVTENARNV